MKKRTIFINGIGRMSPRVSFILRYWIVVLLPLSTLSGCDNSQKTDPAVQSRDIGNSSDIRQLHDERVSFETKPAIMSERWRFTPDEVSVSPWLAADFHAGGDECCSDPGEISECWWMDAVADGVTCTADSDCSLNGNSSGDCAEASALPDGEDGPNGESLCTCTSNDQCASGICNSSGLCGPSFCNGYLVCSCFGGCKDSNTGGFDNPSEMCSTLGYVDGCCEGSYPNETSGAGTGFCSNDCSGNTGCTSDADCQGPTVPDPYSSDCSEFRCGAGGLCVLSPIVGAEDGPCGDNVQTGGLMFGVGVRGDSADGSSCYEGRCDALGKCQPHTADVDGLPCYEDDDGCTVDKCLDGACVLDDIACSADTFGSPAELNTCTVDCVDDLMDDTDVYTCYEPLAAPSDTSTKPGDGSCDYWTCRNVSGAWIPYHVDVNADICGPLSSSDDCRDYECDEAEAQGNCDTTTDINEGLECDDVTPGNCEDAVCAAGACTIVNEPSPLTDDACRDPYCDPSTGGWGYTPDDSETCDDGVSCTDNDHCEAGACVGDDNCVSGDCYESVCNYTAPGACEITYFAEGDTCRGLPGADCRRCDAAHNCIPRDSLCMTEPCEWRCQDPEPDGLYECVMQIPSAENDECSGVTDLGLVEDSPVSVSGDTSCASNIFASGDPQCVDTSGFPLGASAKDVVYSFTYQSSGLTRDRYVITAQSDAFDVVVYTSDDCGAGFDTCTPHAGAAAPLYEQECAVPYTCPGTTYSAATTVKDSGSGGIETVYVYVDGNTGTAQGEFTLTVTKETGCPDVRTWYTGTVHDTFLHSDAVNYPIDINGSTFIEGGPDSQLTGASGTAYGILLNGDTAGLTNGYNGPGGGSSADEMWELNVMTDGAILNTSMCDYGGDAQAGFDTQLALFNCYGELIDQDNDSCSGSASAIAPTSSLAVDESPHYLLVDGHGSTGTYSVALHYEPLEVVVTCDTSSPDGYPANRNQICAPTFPLTSGCAMVYPEFDASEWCAYCGCCDSWCTDLNIDPRGRVMNIHFDSGTEPYDGSCDPCFEGELLNWTLHFSDGGSGEATESGVITDFDSHGNWTCPYGGTSLCIYVPDEIDGMTEFVGLAVDFEFPPTCPSTCRTHLKFDW